MNLLRWRPTRTHLRLDVGTVLDILSEIAYWACDFFVLMRRERNQWHKANRKPFPGRYAMCCPIAAVMTLRRHSLIPFQLIGKSMCSKSDAKRHRGRLIATGYLGLKKLYECCRYVLDVVAGLRNNQVPR